MNWTKKKSVIASISLLIVVVVSCNTLTSREEEIPAGLNLVKISDDALATIYIDPSSVKREGNYASVFVFNKFKREQTFPTKSGIKYLASKEEQIFLCSEKERAIKSSSLYSGMWGNGLVNDFTYQDSEIRAERISSPLLVKSSEEKIFDAVCSIKEQSQTLTHTIPQVRSTSQRVYQAEPSKPETVTTTLRNYRYRGDSIKLECSGPTGNITCRPVE